MTDEPVVSALRAHDRRILQGPASPNPNVAPSVESALPGLDEEARAIAALFLAHNNGPGAGNVLLKLTGDRSVQVASSAARSLVNVTDKPAGNTILAAIPARQDRMVRGFLYLAAGKAKSAPGLDAFREVAKKEVDPGAAESAQVALVRLGGEPERKAFLHRISTATAEKAIQIQDQMLYVGDPLLAKGLLPWFGNKEGVLRLGGDRQDRMARMCDMAVWIAHQLGVKFAMNPSDHLTIYDAGVLAAAKAAIAALPD